MKILKNKLNNFFYLLFDKVILFYQIIISPIIPARCRYYPTCSEYGRQALSWHGPWRGSLLTVHRLCRCQPWGGHGIDFVPLPLYQYQYYPLSKQPRKPSYFKLNSVLPSASSTAPSDTKVSYDYVYRDTISYQAMLAYRLNEIG